MTNFRSPPDTYQGYRENFGSLFYRFISMPSFFPDILYEDNDYIILNKPAGLLVIPDGFNKEKENLRDILLKKFPEIFVVHRIDRQTSGVVCFAKNGEAHRNLSIQFEKRTVKKIYHALLRGIPEKSSGTIDAPIAPYFKMPGMMKIDRINGKKSITEFTVLERYNTPQPYSLAEANPQTGRTHQLRVHFHHIGHPLAIDELYGSPHGIFLSGIKAKYRKKAMEEERPLINRLTLHAKNLSFRHFIDEMMITVEAPMQKDFEVTLKMLRKYAT